MNKHQWVIVQFSKWTTCNDLQCLQIYGLLYMEHFTVLVQGCNNQMLLSGAFHTTYLHGCMYVHVCWRGAIKFQTMGVCGDASCAREVQSNTSLTSKGSVEGSQQSVFGVRSHFRSNTQLGHHVTKGWLLTSHQLQHLLSLKDTGERLLKITNQSMTSIYRGGMKFDCGGPL